MKTQKKERDKIFNRFMVIFTLEALVAILAGVYWDCKVDRALALLAELSAVTLFCCHKKYPEVIRDCCIRLGKAAAAISVFGVAVEYALFPGALTLNNIGITFVPVGTVYTAVCGFMLTILPEGENPPEDVNK